jgi:hypothetical protein
MSKKLNEEIKVQVFALKNEEAHKCPRCMIWGRYEQPDNLCDRCAIVLIRDFPDHPAVPLIREHNKKFLQDLKRLDYLRESAILHEE